MNPRSWRYALPLSFSLAACAAHAPPQQAASTPAGVAPAATAVGTMTPPLRKDDGDRKSKNGRLEATIGGAGVLVQYGRPEVRGRTIFGELVPYGALWRTGANEATTITVDKDVMIEGQPLPAGTYAVFTIPGEQAWTWVFNAEPAQWGSGSADPSKDVLRVEVTPAAAEMTEAMTFSAEADTLVLSWDKTKVAIRISSGS